MEGKRIYLQPVGTLLSAINDLIEIQRGKLTFWDLFQGEIRFIIRMYAFKWELRFTVLDIGLNRCQVKLEIGGERSGRECLVIREFALLDSLMINMAEIELQTCDADTKAGPPGAVHTAKPDASLV